MFEGVILMLEPWLLAIDHLHLNNCIVKMLYEITFWKPLALFVSLHQQRAKKGTDDRYVNRFRDFVSYSV